MIPALKPYPAMKDSGVPWLGEVPEHWDVSRADSRLVARKRPVRASEISSQNVLHYSIPNVQKYGRGAVEAGASVDSSKWLVDRTLLLVSKLNPRKGTIALAEPDPNLTTIASSEFVAMEPRYSNAAFARYVFVSEHVRSELSARVDSATKSHQRCAPRDILALSLAWPPLDEQRAIVRFLDYMDRRIRRYIAAKQKLIKLLEEEKQAIIHQAVTGQIDVRTGEPYPAYKPSGVEWLGDVPEGWEVRKLRSCVSISGGMTPSMENRAYWDGDIPWVTPKDMKQFEVSSSLIRVSREALKATSLRLVQPGAVLMVVRGMILARRVPIALVGMPITINQDMKSLLPGPGLNGNFLARLLDSAQDAFVPLIDEAGHGTRRLPTERWRGLPIPVPPVEEQEAIVEHILTSTLALAATVHSTQSQILLAREYRTRLIADVVTGKLDVLEAAAQLPDEADEPEPLEEAEADFLGSEDGAEDAQEPDDGDS